MLIKCCIKDLKLLLSERRSLLIFFLMPIVLTTILSFALKGSFDEEVSIATIPIAIVKAYDKSADGAKIRDVFKAYIEASDPTNDMRQTVGDLDFETIFFDDFLGSNQMKKVINYQVMSEEEANKALANGTIKAIVILPESFVYDLSVNFISPYRNEIAIKVIASPEASYAGNLVTQIMSLYFDALNEHIVQKNTYLEIAMRTMALSEAMVHMGDIASLESETTLIQATSIPGYKVMKSFTYYSIAMMAMFVLYAASFSGVALMREKQDGTLNRNTSAGVTYHTMLLAKAFMTWCLVMAQMSGLLLFSRFILGVSWRLSPVMIFGMIATAIAVSGFGSVISAITMYYDNPNIPSIFENIIIHIFALLGGSYIPVDVLPAQLAYFKVIAINGIVLDLFIGIYQSLNSMALMPQLLMLVGFGIITFLISDGFMRRKERWERA